jgi:hypothetical protein
MIPVLEYDLGGDRTQVLEEPVVAPRTMTAWRQARTASMAAVWNPKAGKLRTTRTLASVSLPCPKLCSRLDPLVLSTLNVSFPIFQRARPHAASSVTLPALTSKSVTNLL